MSLASQEINLPKFLGVCGIRKLLSLEEDSPLQKVVDNNFIPKLILNLARDDFPQLQFESAWCITNIACGEGKFAQTLIDNNAVVPLVKLLGHKALEVVEQAIWALGNLAGDNVEIRDMIIASGAVDPIAEITVAAPPGTSFTRNSSWTLSNFCRGRPGPKFDLIKNAIIALAKVLKENDRLEIIADICWSFSYITDEGKAGFKTIVDTGVVPRLVQLLDHQSLSIVVPCLRTIGNLLTGNEIETLICL